MRYFNYEPNLSLAVSSWQKSQYELSDIVLFLTDRHIKLGEMIYNLFCTTQIKFILNYFTCNFNKIKSDLNINGNYVKREGNVYAKNFNPKRNITLTTPPGLIARSMAVYNYILQDLEEMCQCLHFNK